MWGDCCDFRDGTALRGEENLGPEALCLSEAAFADCAVWDVQNLVPVDDLNSLADELAGRRVVIATEIGGGVVPLDPAERERREAAGRLSCLLAERAETVIRVCCGLPQLLKGEWP